MSDYRLPMDADGVKYHGTVDQNEENPGHFMYGLDENGNKRIIRTDEQGNVLTKVTGSIVELSNENLGGLIIPPGASYEFIFKNENIKGFIFGLSLRSVSTEKDVRVTYSSTKSSTGSTNLANRVLRNVMIENIDYRPNEIMMTDFIPVFSLYTVLQITNLKDEDIDLWNISIRGEMF